MTVIASRASFFYVYLHQGIDRLRNSIDVRLDQEAGHGRFALVMDGKGYEALALKN